MGARRLSRARKAIRMKLRPVATADGDEDVGNASNGTRLALSAGSLSHFVTPPLPHASSLNTYNFIDTSHLLYSISTSPLLSSSLSDPSIDPSSHSYRSCTSSPSSPGRTLVPNNTSPPPSIIHVDKDQYLWSATTTIHHHHLLHSHLHSIHKYNRYYARCLFCPCYYILFLC